MTAESKENRTPKGTSPNEVLDATSFLFGTNAAFIEGLYTQYLADPNSVDGTWQAFFEALGDRGLTPAQLGRGPSWRRDSKLPPGPGEFISALTGDPGPAPKKAVATPIPPAVHPEAAEAEAQASIRAIQLVRAYRVIGHLEASLDPLDLEKRKSLPQLQPSFYGFHEADLDRPIFIDGVTMGMETATPRQLVQILRRIYCGSIRDEVMHIHH